MDKRSYMVAIPKQREDLNDPKQLMDNLAASKECKIISQEFVDGEENLVEVCGYGYKAGIKLVVEVSGVQYRAIVLPIQFEIPPMVRAQHFFRDIDIKTIEGSQVGLDVVMEFSDDPFASYHAQLKLVSALVPDAVAVLDDSAEKMLSGKWVRFAASSDVYPAPKYIYTIQAISGDEDDVWLHTHGLKRCGIPELEILNSSKQYYGEHGRIIETLASRMLEEPAQQGEPVFLARLTEDIDVVTTFIDWKDALKFMPKNILGGEEDRKEGHNEDTCVVFAYANFEDFQQHKLSHVAIYDDVLEENPLYMFTARETERMKNLAIERIDYMVKAFEDKANKIIAKIGIEVDEEFKDGDIENEHIWFEINDISGDSVTAILTQDPYYVKDMKKGSIATYGFDKITDWVVYTPNGPLTPDDVYMMDV